jgi:hypothetical protein
MFAVFVKQIGGHIATDYNDVGGYRLDYAAPYGGYNVEQISNGGGGVRHPFGPRRRKAEEMWHTLYFAVDVLYVVNKNASAQ